MSGVWIKCLIASAVVATATAAEPYIPADDDEVLETLPRSLLASRDELAKLRQRLAEEPKNADLAGRVGQLYLEMGNLEGDPRFYGYARSAIEAWWTAPAPPAVILKLRAELKEKDHLYDDAIVDLQRLLESDPQDAQAWIEIANIYRVQGRYDEARRACGRLGEFAGPIPTAICRVPLQAATGEAEAAYATVEDILPAARAQYPTTVQWMLTMQARIAQALGREKQAEQHYREGLENNPEDTYLIRSYGDFLLDLGRNEEALALLRDHTRDNGVLLRAAIAARRCGESALADAWQAQLGVRFEEIRLRESEPHGRFESRYMLELRQDPPAALRLALENWQKQKETRDIRNVLEAAIAAESPAAAEPVLEFLEVSGNEDVVLRKLASQLDRSP